jgi:hypothetical protein
MLSASGSTAFANVECFRTYRRSANIVTYHCGYCRRRPFTTTPFPPFIAPFAPLATLERRGGGAIAGAASAIVTRHSTASWRVEGSRSAVPAAATCKMRHAVCSVRMRNGP